MPAPPPAGWDPNAPVIPPWVDPNAGWVWGEDYDKTPMMEWYPNGKYGWDDPYLNGDALMRNEQYPRYGAYSPPDPNWRPSFYGETPPWQINPNAPWQANTSPGQWFGNTLNGPPPPENTPEELAQFQQEIEQRRTRRTATFEADRMQRQQAQEAGAIFVRDNKKQRWGVYYPPGYQGPKVEPKGQTPDRQKLVQISDPRQLGEEGKDWQVYNLQGGYEVWDNQPKMSFADAQGLRRPASNVPPGPEPEVVQPGRPAAQAPPPQMTGPELEESRRGNPEYFDRYGNYNPDGYSSGPQMSQEEQQYWAQQKKTDPRVYQSTMYDPGDWAGQDTQRRMQTTRGPGGAARMSWNTQDPQYAALSAEQKAAGEAKMAAFNQQFDPNNRVNPANDKLYKVQQMSPQLRQTLMQNAAQSTPAQRAAWAQWGDALTQYNQSQQPKPQPTPGPNPFMGPKPATPQAQPPQQDRQFQNNNPFMNAKGELRNRAMKKIGHMVAGTGGLVNPFA